MHSPTTDDWSNVWAEYDAREGYCSYAPKPATPWYLDPQYTGAPRARRRLPNAARAPLAIVAGFAVLLLMVLLNVRVLPGESQSAASEVGRVGPRPGPAFVISVGGRAVADVLPQPVAEPRPFGTPLDVPPPAWVAPEPAPAPAVQALPKAGTELAVRAAIRATLARPGG